MNELLNKFIDNVSVSHTFNVTNFVASSNTTHNIYELTLEVSKNDAYVGFNVRF